MRPALPAALSLLLAACMEAAPPADIADGPLPPRHFVCADGTELDYIVDMMGIILVIGDESIRMEQIWVEGMSGRVHQAGRLGWVSGWPDGGTLIRIGEGETIETAPQIPCTESPSAT